MESSFTAVQFSEGGYFVTAGVALFALALIASFVWYYLHEARKVQYKFLTVGSHKLRTPLSKIGVAVAELIEKKEAADARKEPYVVEEYEERMLRQIAIEQQRLVGLVNLLLEVSESERGYARYDKKLFDLVVLIREILVGYQTSRWRNDRVFIDFESHEQELEVYADRRRIASALQVLLENAITYSPAGGKVRVILTKDRRRVKVCVIDQGIGVEKKERRHIFKKFYRGDQALRIDTEGTGVGLFLAQHIVGGHGGKMWFASRGKRQGSTFCFSLPLKG